MDNNEWLVAQTAELVALKEKTNHEALLELASSLNGGKSCHLNSHDRLGRRLMGGMHVNLEILFDDGTIWLARILERHIRVLQINSGTGFSSVNVKRFSGSSL